MKTSRWTCLWKRQGMAVACLTVLLGGFYGGSTIAVGQEGAKPAAEKGTEKGKEAAAATAKVASEAGSEDNKELKRLFPKHDVFLDNKHKAVIVDGVVCLREGQLEMFACPKGTKEHESVLSLNCMAEQVHAALLAAGAKPGTPVSFNPKYKAATGQVIDIFVLWRDEKGEKHRVRAQEWVQHVKSMKELEYDWVFAGSGFWEDEETKEKHYQANSGDFICVSNFPTATLDLPVESSQANSSLMFNAFSDRIPAKGTKVRLVLIPRKSAGEKPAKEKEAKSAESAPKS